MEKLIEQRKEYIQMAKENMELATERYYEAQLVLVYAKNAKFTKAEVAGISKMLTEISAGQMPTMPESMRKKMN